MKTHMRILVQLVIAFVSISITEAQITKVGTTSAKFLSIPIGARAIGMGGAFTAVANDASAMFWNPAGIAEIHQNEAMFSHSSWVAEINLNYAALAMPIEGFGTIGLHFTSMSMDDMEKTTELQQDGTGQYFSVGSIAASVSYARRLTDWFSLGGTFKYINEHISSSNATGFAFEIGTLFTTPFQGLKFGAGISNFGTKMQMRGDDLLIVKDISTNAGSNSNLNGFLGTDQFDLPLNLRIGFSYEPISTEDQRVMIVVDAQHPNDNAESVNIGGEYSAFSNTIAVRGGYKALGLKESEERFTLGAGLRYPVSTNLLVKFDYAYQKIDRLGNPSHFTISVQF